MRTRPRLCLILVVLFAFSCPLSAADGGPGSPAEQATEILDATAVKGGLIVHLGCGDGRLTAALCRDTAYRVHGLDVDAGDVQQARQFIRSRGSYGPVSVEQWSGPHLPYGDNLVNLLVADELGQVPMEEVIRVLVPRGVAYVKRGSTWHKQVKPCPPDVDEWTHFLHDASGNAVAHDRVVGPPRTMQWIADPRHTRSHEHIPSINALVSAQGRIFYIADEAPVASLREPSQWRLVARDAYNGILLWKRPIEMWFPHIVNWGYTPRHLQRRLIVVGDRLYVTLGLHSPLSAVDATTGQVLKVYEDTEGTEEVIHHQGIVLLATRSVTDERRSELARWAQLTREKHSPLHERDSAQPLVNRLRATERKGGTAVVALEARSGRVLWRKAGADAAGLRAQSLCAGGDRVFYQKGKDIVCVHLRSGDELWSARAAPLRLICEGAVFCAGGNTIAALSAETGKTQWTRTALLTDIRDLFLANGSLWVGGFKPFPQKRGPSWGPYFATQRDPASGKVLTHIECENPGHHHRCYQNKATDRYILAGRRGTEFIDLVSGEVREHSWARGVCKYGVMPCNGLMYAPPHACACYVGTKVTGFSALASAPFAGASDVAIPAEGLLQRGSAYEHVRATSEEGRATKDWPTYRCDATRSGFTRAKVPATLKPAWQRDLGGRLSSPVIADGKVFLTSVDTHTVHVLGADSGEPVWTFTADGRVDSPPTILAGRVLFGCRDGSVYCLRASDGALAWRFQGTGRPRRIMARGQLESARPAHGSVLVQNDAVYFTMGRSSYLDGGIDLFRLDPKSGKILSRTQVYSPDPETGKQPSQFAPYSMPGVRPDILVGDGDHVYLRDMAFDSRGVEGTGDAPRLITLTDFLDDWWPHRSYWIFGTRISISTGCSGQVRGLIYGRLLVFDDSAIYGYGRTKLHWSNQLQDGAYRLFATSREQGKQRWAKPVKAHVRAMVLAGRTLFVAGPPIAPESGPGGPDTTPGALLLAVAGSDGGTLAQYNLEAPPVFDGMAAVANHLYLTLANGTVVCMEARASLAKLAVRRTE